MDTLSRASLRKALPVVLVIALLLAVSQYIDSTAGGEITGASGVEVQAAPSAEPPAGVVSPPEDTSQEVSRSITETVQSGESLYLVFQKHGLDQGDLALIEQAAKDVYDLRLIRPGSTYTITVAGEDISAISCNVTQDETLHITRDGQGSYLCELVKVPYERKVAHIGGVIRGDLGSSMGNIALALELSEIFAWDIDFTTDLREGDTFRIVVEELWVNGEFRRHGRILAAEMNNNGTVHRAYRHEIDGVPGYYGPEGRSVKRAFLKAPLSFKRISSGYGTRRHPVTKKYHVHRGIDYAAPRGTPVSAVGDGTVEYAGYKGANGNIVIIRHPNGYRTYYGHLNKIAKGVRKGHKVVQGQVIGTVGSTGRATGPHLDYRIKKGNKFLNPQKLVIPKGSGVPGTEKATFDMYRQHMDANLGSIPAEELARLGDTGTDG